MVSIWWVTKYDDEMMHRSTYIMVRPMVTLVFLLTMGR